ncbi:hypothetical protein C8Q75DRAFT_778382 [Abortiporus biennis]|nr:hypothetical protein C8Q75DRAFT_778382 [Abortiporus biennis]
MALWSDALAQQRSSLAAEQLSIFMLGVYGYDYLLTFGFEWQLITRKIVFRPTYIFYFMGRYCMLFALATIVSIWQAPFRINCDILVPIMTTVGFVATASATANLMLRTLVIWKHKRCVFYPLILTTIFHFTFVISVGASQVQARWIVSREGCGLRYINDKLTASIFIFTVIYDLAILLLTSYGISRISPKSALVKMLYHQGILYFLFTCMVNIPALVFFILDVNAQVTAILTIPASTISVMISCRSVIDLMQVHKDKKPSSVGGEVESEERNPYRNSSGPVFSSHLAFPSAVYGAHSTGSDVENDRENTNIHYSYKGADPIEDSKS